MIDFFSTALALFIDLGALGMAASAVAVVAFFIFGFLEKGVFSFLAVASFVAAMAFFGHATPKSFVVFMQAHGVAIAAFLAGYLVVGVAWSIAKFYFYARGLNVLFKQAKASFLAKAGASTVEQLSPAALSEFRHEMSATMTSHARYGSFPVMAHQHKAVIIFWMGYWPASMLAYLIDEPIKKLMNSLYAAFSGVYAKIAHDQSREYMADMGK